ncbi:PKD domain-containing protein [Candidatus Nitrosocosmicus sp. R]
MPTANAGSDQSVDSGDAVLLDGSGSSDPRNETLTYKWIQPAGPSVSLSDATSVIPHLRHLMSFYSAILCLNW